MCILSKFADDTKLEELLTPCSAARPGRETLTHWRSGQSPTTESLTRVLDSASEQDSPGFMYRLGAEKLESPTKRDLGVLADSKLDLSQQCALAAKRANHTLGCIRPNSANQLREGIIPLHCAQSHLEHCVGTTI